MKKYTFISIAPKRFGGIDLLTPLFFDLKTNYDVKLIQFFYKIKAYQDLKKDDFLHSTWKKSIDKSYVLSNSKIIFKLFFNFKLLLRIIISKNVILLTDGKISKRNLKFLQYIIFLKKAKFLCHPSILSIEESNNCKNLINLTFSKKSNKNLNEISIGFPKLYYSWKSEVHKYNVENPFIKKDQKLITVFVPSTVKNVFDNEELNIWLNEVLESISIYCPGFLVMLKPHPMLEIKILENIIEKYPKIIVEISYLNPSLLANASSFIISHHSATILDGLFLKRKVIVYIKLTDNWLKRHPDGSVYSKLNVLFTSSQKSLYKNIEKCLENEMVDSMNIESLVEHEYGVLNLF